MGDTLFLFGAGINRAVSGRDGLMPPLARDFFRQVLRHRRLGEASTLNLLSPLLDFIRRFWHMDRTQLLNNDFDLEDCYTFIELQRREAHYRGDSDSLSQASQIHSLLTGLFLDYLSGFRNWPSTSDTFQALGRLIYSTQSGVLTFNYDTLLESAIENASPHNQEATNALMHREVSTANQHYELASTLRQQGLSEEEILDKISDDAIFDEHIGFSPHLWKPFLAYKVRFDEVTLPSSGLPRIVPGKTYYEHSANTGNYAPFLKLHGSINWFVHSGYRVDGRRLSGESAASEGKTVLGGGIHHFGVPPITSGGEILLPIIITPVLNKPYDQHPFFKTIWSEARNELQRCRKLVIGGYSFPPTDFHVRRLLRESFCERSPDDLCVINPDTSVIRIAKELCNYKKPVLVCADLDEFIKASV